MEINKGQAYTYHCRITLLNVFIPRNQAAELASEKGNVDRRETVSDVAVHESEKRAL